MCTFRFEENKRFLKLLKIPEKVNNVSEKELYFASYDCEASLEISNMSYSVSKDKVSSFILTNLTLIALNLISLYYSAKASVFFFENQALSDNISSSMLTFEINSQQFLLFVMSIINEKTHKYARLVIMLAGFSLAALMLSLSISALQLFRRNRFRNTGVHAIRCAAQLCLKMQYIMIFVLIFFKENEYLTFFALQLVLCYPIIYFTDEYKLSFEHRVYSEGLLWDLVRQEAMYVYFYGYPNFTDIKAHKAFAVFAYLVLYANVFAYLQKRERLRVNVCKWEERSSVLQVSHELVQKYQSSREIAVRVQRANMCQNPLHHHITQGGVPAGGLRNALPEYLAELRLNEFDSHCYALVSPDFFDQVCPICLDYMSITPEQILVSVMEQDRQREVRHINSVINHHENRDELTQLNCLHIFHRECIDLWLREQRVCPECRGDVLK